MTGSGQPQDKPGHDELGEVGIEVPPRVPAVAKVMLATLATRFDSHAAERGWAASPYRRTGKTR